MAYLLVVDDDEDFTNAIEIVLQNAGHEVQTQQDIEGGLKSMKEKPPDLVILDVMFPENSSAGFDLARTMKREEKLKDVPVLILSAVNTKFFLGFGSGDIDEDWLPVHDFLEKPMDFDVLKNKVNELLQKAGSGNR
jgi:DNA-binding response OmpR family regulator